MTRSIFAAAEMAPRDPILGLTEAFNADPRANKVNLGVGVYCDDSGKIPLLEAVKIAERARIDTAPPRGYQPIDGSPAFNRAARDLLFGASSPAVAAGRVVTVQALGGTGALRVGADFLKRVHPLATVHISDPSWENHRALFEAAGFKVDSYPYYDSATQGVDFGAMMARLSELPEAAVVVLHACCHNPTGADLTERQWRAVADTMATRGLVAFVDFAYQGLADGLDDDAVVLRLLVDAGLEVLVASSFSKSLSLYGERVGALSIVTAGAEESARVLSQIKRIVRTSYSNPPTHGGAITAAVLSNAELRAMWEADLAAMRGRIRAMRQGLVDRLVQRGVTRDFSFVTRQRGMFSYTGLSARQVERLQSEFGIYAVGTGRICVAALNSHNIDHVCEALAAVAAD